MNAPRHVEWHHHPVLHLCFRNICCTQAASAILIHMYTYSIQAWSLFEISGSERSPSISWWIVSSLYNLHFERHIRRQADAVNGTRDCLSCLFLSVPHFIMNNTAKPRLIFTKTATADISQWVASSYGDYMYHCNHPLEAHLSSSAPP